VESSAPRAELVDAMAALWSTPKIEHDLYQAPAFRRLRETCATLFPDSGSASTLDFALARALRALACPATDPVPGHMPMPAEEAALRLTLAFGQTDVERIHLAPLDMAGDFPRIAFGPAEAGHFPFGELRRLLEGPAGPRGRPSGLDARHLCQFRWLVVREVNPVSTPGIQRRALPELSLNMNEDFGRIVPHAKSRPDVVEAALFALLLLPWEDHDTDHNPEYRVFQIPWIYTVEHDLFGRTASTPDTQALTEFDEAIRDDDGNTIGSVLRPYVIHLDESVGPMAASLDQTAWDDLQAALSHPLFAGPVAHFFVRAFFSDPIDEFMGHAMTLEAALGSSIDHDNKARRSFGKDGNPGATVRLSARLTALLDPDAGETYEQLFELRSQYVHGRTMGDIPSTARHQARVLARRGVTALVNRALQPSDLSREDHLDALLCAGIGPVLARREAARTARRDDHQI